MEPAPEKSRGPPAPQTAEQTGERLNVRQAAQIIGISERTLSDWAKRGSTSFGFELDVKRVPVTHHRRSTQTPRTFLQSRFLILTSQVAALRDILRTEPRRPGPISPLEAATRCYRSSLSHPRNSPALS
jgi:hypothetical protein